MRIRILAASLATFVLVLAVVSTVGAAGTPDPNNTLYTKTIRPLGNGLGIARITTTEASTDPQYDFRQVSGGAISSARQLDPSTYKVFGAQLGFGSSGTFTVNDVTAFNFTFDPANPDTLTVWRNWVFTRGTVVTDVGLGGVSSDGTIAVRVEGSGGKGLGSLQGTWSGPPTALSSYADADAWTRFAGGTTCTSNMNPPGIGNDDHLQAFCTWGTSGQPGWIQVGRSNLTPTGSACGNVCCQDLSYVDSRGGVVINSASRKIAVMVKKAGDVSDQISLLRVFEYTDNGTSISASFADYDFSGAIPGKVCSGTNFFSQTGFRGPEPLSINNNGDIAFPVVVVDPGFSGSWRAVPERAILLMEAANPGVFKVVCANYDGNSSPALFYQPQMYAPTFGGVAVDDSKNVFFSYTNWMGLWAGQTKSTNCVYKATADDAANPTAWTVEPVAWLGMTWKDPEDNRIYNIALLYLFNTGVDYYANPAAFANKNLNRTPILGESFGGFLLSVGLGDDDPTTTGLMMNACYVAPTKSVPGVSSTLQAIQAPDGEPVNLMNCVVLAQGPDYVDLEGNIWSQYYAADDSYGAIRVSTIRSDLEPGDVIHVSGRLGTDGDRYVHSGGVVLIDRGQKRPVLGMTNRSVGSMHGPSTLLNYWVRVWGRVSDLDTAAMTFKIDDGSGSPVTVDYTNADFLYSPPQNGAYVAVSGRCTGASPKTVSMYRGDS